MQSTLFKKYVFVASMAVPLAVIFADNTQTDKDRIACLEARLLKLEARLSEIEENAALLVSDPSAKPIDESEARLACIEKEADLLRQQSAKKNVFTTDNSRPIPADLPGKVLEDNTVHHPKWMKAELWVEIQPEMSMEQVIERLGPPSRTLQSLKPLVDEVFYYQFGLRKSTDFLQGKISFRKDKVISVEKPDFGLNSQMDQAE